MLVLLRIQAELVSVEPGRWEISVLVRDYLELTPAVRTPVH